MDLWYTQITKLLTFDNWPWCHRSILKGQRSKVNRRRSKVNHRFMIHSNNETFDLWRLTLWCQRSKAKGQRSKANRQRSKVKGKRSKVKGQSSKVKAWSQSSKTFSYDFFNMRPMTSQITLESCAETADQLFECILRNKWESCGVWFLVITSSLLMMTNAVVLLVKCEQVLLFECIINRRWPCGLDEFDFRP